MCIVAQLVALGIDTVQMSDAAAAACNASDAVWKASAAFT